MGGLIYELSCGCEIRNNILRWNGLDPRGASLGVPFVIQNAENANIHNNYFESLISMLEVGVYQL